MKLKKNNVCDHITLHRKIICQNPIPVNEKQTNNKKSSQS